MDNYGIIYFGVEMDWDLFTRFLYKHLVTWLFFLVMLASYVRTSNIHASQNEKIEQKEVLKLSVVMFISYALMIPIELLVTLFDFSSRYFPYTVYLFLDIFTILLICFLMNTQSNKALLCKRYIVFCLSCNSVLFLLVQIDLILMYEDFKPFKAWWFWDVFTIGINFFDAVMILVLLSYRDILLLHKFESQFLARRNKKLRVGELK